eukprot:g49120.t1
MCIVRKTSKNAKEKRYYYISRTQNITRHAIFYNKPIASREKTLAEKKAHSLQKTGRKDERIADWCHSPWAGPCKPTLTVSPL